jgi:hypothetical protein
LVRALSVENIQLISAPLLVALVLRGFNLDDEAAEDFDTAVKTLALENADFDLDHAQPAGMFGRGMELETHEARGAPKRRRAQLGAMVGDLDPAPRAMCIEKNEKIGGAITTILVVAALGPSRRGRDRLTRLAY